MRVTDHPVLGKLRKEKVVKIIVDGKILKAVEGEPIIATLLANGIRVCRRTRKKDEPRFLFCGIGRCTDCVMIVDGVPNVRTCITPVKEGMRIKTQVGLGNGATLNAKY